MDGCIAVRTVQAHGVAVPVQVPVVDKAVAVTVHCIADVERAGVDRRDLVVAVVPTADSVCVTIPVPVTGDVPARAVLVDAVAADLQSAGVDRGVAVRAVQADRGAVAVEVPVIDNPIAVVVDSLADVERAGVDVRCGVIAVRAAAGGVEESVPVLVPYEVSPRTVLVDPVATQFGCSGMDAGVRIGAVQASREPVPVEIAVVDEAVAVGVHAIAVVPDPWVDGGVQVVTIRAPANLGGITVSVLIQRLVGPGAILVDAVGADLHGAGVDVEGEIVAVRTGRVPVAVLVAVVDCAVAVRVDSVAGVVEPWTDDVAQVVAVVAATCSRDVTVPIDVGQKVSAGAVLVDPITTDLQGAGVDGWVGVVAVIHAVPEPVVVAVEAGHLEADGQVVGKGQRVACVLQRAIAW